MLNIEPALKEERLLRALTGFNRQAFTRLVSTFSVLYQESCYRPERQRAYGGGRKARLLQAQDRLFFILFYFKCDPTFDVAGL